MTNVSDERLLEGGAEARARPAAHVDAAIEKAAALSGRDAPDFVREAAYRAALATIASHERTTLAPEDRDAFLADLDSPPQPTDALRRAVQRHRREVIAR